MPKKSSTIIGLLFLWFVTTSQADITIDILGGNEQLLPIAVLPIDVQVTKPLKHDMHTIITNNLLRSGLFSLIKVPAQGTTSAGGRISYAFYRKLGIENLVIASISDANENHYAITLSVYDVLLRKKIKNFRLIFPAKNIRRAGHQVSDLVFHSITGQESAFSSYIAFISINKDKTKGRSYRLRISDSDGHNAKTILKSTAPILSPAWSPDGQQLAYVSFENGRSEIYVQNPWQASRKVVASYPGINSSPAWSPNGKHLLMTLSNHGNSEIYQMNLATKKIHRLTNHSAIDTEASFSADGKEIFFTSDRAGTPQIYRANIHNQDFRPYLSEVQQVTKKGRYNAGASLSQDGKYLALVHAQEERGERLGISLYDIENEEFYPITTTFLDDSPSLSPKANMIVYSAIAPNRRDGQLIIMNLRGQSKIRLRTPNGEVKDPAWGPINTVSHEKLYEEF